MPATATQVALSVVELTRAGRFDEVRDLFAPPLRPMVTSEALAAAWSAAIDRLGPVTSVGTPVGESSPGVVLVKVPLAFERGGLTAIVAVTSAGQLSGVQLAPAEAMQPAAAWEPPAYADPSTFAEEEVTLGSAPLAVPGTLSLPRRAEPLTAVVLLAGSGPMDRDETIGPNKPFRDLAWGLASRGVAVLRFDKVTHVHPEECRANAAFTLTDEYVPQALAALGLLRGHPAIDPSRVFIAGHSLGGTVAPRVAATEPAVAGLAILAGGAQPLQWAIVRQIRYLSSLEAGTTAGPASALETLTRQAERVDGPDLSASTPAADLPLGTPAPYWLDLRAYDAPAAAARLAKPMLVLQGARDYQATVDDDLARWQAALAGRPDVTIRVVSSANHFFFVGSGSSTPQESLSPQHVDPAVVDTLADWLRSTPVVTSPGR